MNEFIGRQKELNALNEWYSSDRFELAVVYGRRRVGKTSLLEEFVRGKDNIFITAKRVKGNANVRSLRAAVCDAFGADTERMDIDELLEEIGKHSEKRQILVIDEFPYFAGSDEELMSSLQIFIDRRAQFSKLFIILCGSSMGFMKRQVMGGESPLCGRRTRELFLEPMDYLESAEFLEGRTAFEKASVYGAVGGVPLYLKKFSGKGNIFRIMAEEFFKEGFTLFSEPESLMMQELRDPRYYNDVIEAMAAGKARMSEISDRAGILNPHTSVYLTDLVDLGYVEKAEPFNEENGRRTLYFLSDNLFRFRYHMAVNKRKQILSDTTDRTSKNIEREMPDYMGKVFEGICAQFVKRIGYPITGRWWGIIGKETREIDVIGSYASGGKRIGLYAECKFTNRRADVADMEDLFEKADRVKGIDIKRYALFSRLGFTDDLEVMAEARDVMLVHIDDMYDHEFIERTRQKHVG